ncbi:SDR family oxidoreductase [Sinomonas sp. ASV486]|uniref:SDR family oxidoreductase n=1 Tax=Sinomonas sp. ASV486 TaxID=3051170 RepID=UPI0027DD8D45|nr:SDR family oxidoreductase [Sinomonas sp. ASV486]MDQ4491599.1 SDR family oxidoreductase [Sinomonas sp. ASV486]
MYRGTRLRGTRVLITGGASGIGRLMALESARRGAEVVIWDLSADGAAAVVAEIVATGGLASSYPVDVTDTAHVAEAARQTGDVDVVVNNAGVVSGQTLLEASESALRRTLEVNVLALYWVTRAFLPGMIARGRGTVVTIASAAGLVGVARQTDYSASKFGAFGFTESLRAELRADGHDVGTLVVCPYYINTGMFEGVETKFPALLPILEEHDVALKVIDGIESGREQIILPPFARLVPLMRFLPTRAFDRVADFFGINHTMDHFVGRAGAKRVAAGKAGAAAGK